jgi:Flp pilus assembly protein TadD
MKLMFKHRGDNGAMGETAANKKPRRFSRRRLVILTTLLVLAIVGALAYWLVKAQERPAIDIGKGDAITATVQTLTPQQQEQVAAVQLLMPSLDMEWAYAKAVALSALGKHQESLKVYGSLDKTGKAPYYMYVEYALTASRAGDSGLASRTLTKALEKLETDTSVSAADKAVLKRRLPGKLEAFKEGS